MGIFEKLPNKEELEDYITSYAGYESVSSSRPQASLEKLMRFWEKNKGKYLYDLLGGKFIVEKEIEVNRPLSKIKSDIEESLYCGAMRTFSDNFLSWVENRYETSERSDQDFKENMVLSQLVESRPLAEGKLTTSRQVKVKLTDDITIPIQNGVKPTRILSKISRIANIPGFEDFRIELSRILNEKTLKGTMCLSIHPLDYLTMSDNPYGWDSCMNWVNSGQYRMGTVEMMNSSCVVIAYLKGDKPLRFYDDEWNGKKWRNLFIVTEDFITGIKGYPYQNADFDIRVLDWLKDLAKDNLEWTYGDPIEFSPDSNEGTLYDGDDAIYYEFASNIMYNDFGNNNTTHIVLAPRVTDKCGIECCYSGEAECMYCGERVRGCIGDLEDIDDEGCVICNECLVTYTCDGCGERVISEDDLYELDGQFYCENCYNDNAVEDQFTGELHHADNCRRIYLLAESPENLSIDTWRARFINCYDADYSLSDFISCVHSFANPRRWWNETVHYITPADLTEKGFNHLSESDFTQLEECIERITS